jgi:hypothetical protein
MLPPIREDVTHPANQIGKVANAWLETAAVHINMSSNISVLPVCKELKTFIKKNAPC